MTRTLSLATTLAVALVLPAMAEDANTKVEPGKGPMSTMTDQVPQLKRDAQAIDQAAPNTGTPSSSGTTTVQKDTTFSLTEQEAKTWIDKPVYSGHAAAS